MTSDPEVIKYVADQMVVEAGTPTALMAVDVLMEGQMNAASAVESRSERQAGSARVFWDSTGDSDIVAHVSAPYEKAVLAMALCSR